MLQVIAVMIYVCAAGLALAVLVGSLRGERSEIGRALIGARSPRPSRARLVGRGPRVRAIRLRPAQQQLRAAA